VLLKFINGEETHGNSGALTPLVVADDINPFSLKLILTTLLSYLTYINLNFFGAWFEERENYNKHHQHCL
jgi:hypothetical protein